MNVKGRSCLPPLSTTRRPVEEWPNAAFDDLGVWPNPQTPRASVKPLENPGSNREFQLGKDKLAFFDKECSRIAEHIYLGSDAVAKKREILRINGITHVLNCVVSACPEYFKHDLVYKTLWLQDTPSEDITSILYDVFDYFEDVREQGGKSFEDAFQYVKAAREVTKPNTGFAFQLLQCQKRVHAVPASPNSVLRMYRMAPHSPHDALHLVPKMVDHPGKHALDSRGAFVVHVPCAVYVWVGKRCIYVMSNSAASAANQVIRQLSADGCDRAEGKKVVKLASENDNTSAVSEICVGQRKVDEYDLDFKLYHKALAGGVVPPFSVSNTESETCLPARENGWGRLRQKFASGIMKEFVKSSKLGCNSTPVNDSFDCSPDRSLIRSKDPCDEGEHSSSSSKFSSKSPFSPSTSDYASSFTFSPSSSNWSSQQPSPSGIEATDLSSFKHSSAVNSCLPYKESFPSLKKGSHPPPRMWLPSADAPVPRKLVKSWSFSLPDLDDTVMNDLDRNEYEPEDNREDLMLDVEWPSLNKVKMHRSHILESTATYMLSASESSSGVRDRSSVLYVWLGRNVGCEEEQSQLLSCDGTHRDWESISRDFLNKMDFPLNASIQIIREGEGTRAVHEPFQRFYRSRRLNWATMM
ncbi:Mitogen-activated protein kinase phosphatase 1 isoform 2 [Hibiscus syriacus]|uniref:Mitogen-activated protein kinase phosphatase 1 isoform 2 n=1 Tax=Hibiscus syriacus TaxID=106335 RepID=A0A6A2ZFM5_HIBSY|nr:Mitogen-activated protein kinase phosphatase 1 isoform 2 [Hibiscus syriacus]